MVLLSTVEFDERKTQGNLNIKETQDLYTPFHSAPHMVFRVLLLIGKSFDNDQRRKYACFTRAIIHDFFRKWNNILISLISN